MRRIMSEFRSTSAIFVQCIRRLFFQRTYSIKGPGKSAGDGYPETFGTPGFMGVALTSRDGKTRPAGAESLFCPFGGTLPRYACLWVGGVIQIRVEFIAFYIEY